MSDNNYPPLSQEQIDVDNEIIRGIKQNIKEGNRGGSGEIYKKIEWALHKYIHADLVNAAKEGIIEIYYTPNPPEINKQGKLETYAYSHPNMITMTSEEDGKEAKIKIAHLDRLLYNKLKEKFKKEEKYKVEINQLDTFYELIKQNETPKNIVNFLTDSQ